jgi:Cytidylate kinase-like family
MRVRVITIEREFGSGAAKIAERFAHQIGWKLWDQLLTSEIARLADCDRCEVEQREERMDPLYYRLLKSVLRGSFEGSLNVHRLKLLDADTIFKLTEQVVRKAAGEGNCVLVGRGSAFFLRNRQDAFHVFLYAPYEDKVRRLVEGGMSKVEAAELIDSVDQDRADFIKKYFGQIWPDRHLYHQMINTHMGDEAVVQTIQNGIATLQNVT